MGTNLSALLSILYELGMGKGDPSAKEDQQFLDAFARAFLSWQFVEANLASIYAHLAQGYQAEVAEASYHAVLNLNIRLGMIDSAMGVAFKDDPLLTTWLKLSERVTDRARNRNNLAHFTVAVKEKKGGGDRYYLRPSISNPLAETYEFDKHQITQFRDDFMALATALRQFEEEIGPILWARIMAK